jgi:hypothetical protein
MRYFLSALLGLLMMAASALALHYAWNVSYDVSVGVGYVVGYLTYTDALKDFPA